MLPLTRATIVAAALVSLSAFATAQAFAHPTFEVAQAVPGSTYKGVLRIPHGCKGQATHTVRIAIPEGVVAAKPKPKAGWTLTIRKGRYAKTYDYFGRPLSEGAKEIVWSNGALLNDHYDEFVFSARLAPDLPVGRTIYFPVVQECANGSERWIDIPAPGQDVHSLRSPAPQLALIAAGATAGAGPAAPSFKAGHLVVTAPWVRATPKGAPVAGGYLTVTNDGTEPDRLIGGTFAAAGRFEVHEMTMDNGVMRMRPLTDGLEIKPGQSVELKPGGSHHLMFMGLKEQLKAGDTVKGTLVFAKSGAVKVVYRVGAMGGPAPAKGGHQH